MGPLYLGNSRPRMARFKEWSEDWGWESSLGIQLSLLEGLGNIFWKKNRACHESGVLVEVWMVTPGQWSQLVVRAVISTVLSSYLGPSIFYIGQCNKSLTSHRLLGKWWWNLRVICFYLQWIPQSCVYPLKRIALEEMPEVIEKECLLSCRNKWRPKRISKGYLLFWSCCSKGVSYHLCVWQRLKGMQRSEEALQGVVVRRLQVCPDWKLLAWEAVGRLNRNEVSSAID